MSNSIALALFILSHVALRPSGQTSSSALRSSLLLFIRPALIPRPPDLVFFNLLCICYHHLVRWYESSISLEIQMSHNIRPLAIPRRRKANALRSITDMLSLKYLQFMIYICTVYIILIVTQNQVAKSFRRQRMWMVGENTERL